MTVREVMDRLGAVPVNLADEHREVTGGYCGDFLSFVMGKAPAGCCWFTVMTNLNVCAVATLADVAMVAVCENCHCDPALVERARQHGVNLVEVPDDVFTAVGRFLG